MQKNAAMKQNILIIILYLWLPDLLFGQTIAESFYGFTQIEDFFLIQLAVYPQEKLHLHTDRDYYVSGEKIWFKAYVTDAATFQYPTLSRYVHVELINSNDSLINRVIIRPENGMFYGYLPISNDIFEDNYTLRAYTRYMENLGDDYFFKKNIRITNSDIAGRYTKHGKNPTNHSPGFDVSFFPEGGNLVENAFCKVAFKALNQNGYAETISGIIIDETGAEITMVQTEYAGMGAITYIPQAGKRYFLKCQNNDGLEKQFELPQPDAHAISLTVVQRNKMITIGVRRSTNSSAIPCYLLGHCRGMVFYFSSFGSINDFINFPEESLPTGVLQFVLFDEQLNPLSERLVFNKNSYIQVKVDFQTDKPSYEKREKVTATLTPSLSEGVGEDLLSHLSVAITDDKDIAVDSTTTILSTLLLSSELKGYIENPAYYLMDNQESAIALDYLMLTHGWRRYNIPEVVKENYETPRIPFQTSQRISGKLQGGIRSRPVPDSEILIMAKEGDFGLTKTDENGKFIFDNFEYPDSTSYFVQALDSRASYLIEPVLNDESFPKLTHAPQSLFSKQKIKNLETKEEAGMDTFLEKAEQRSKYDDDMRVINLEEVEVVAPRIEKKNEPRLQFWANSSSDLIIRREEFEKRNPILVADILRNVSGLGGKPLVLIDGIVHEWPERSQSDPPPPPYDSPLETVSVHDVESIDVFKFASAAMFGTRGAGGVISITTRRGIDVIREIEKIREEKAHNYTHYTPLGYQKPVEFYSPRYETLEAKYQSIPDYRTTIFWKPDIVIDEDGEASFEFYTSDFPTTYSVVIEGLTTDGRIIRQVEKIVVN